MRRVRVAFARLRAERRSRPRPVRPESTSGVSTLVRQQVQPRSGVRGHPVIEIFGPTIQGEGAEAGLSTHFVRFGGCDYRCSWCDTMYAVDPVVVRATAERLSDDAIVGRLEELGGAPRWVTLSGGNPALHHLGTLVGTLHPPGFPVGAGTQGSVGADWLPPPHRPPTPPQPPRSGLAPQ